ncbi:MAG: hypothetical protein WCK86_22855, partial [Planctomycetia bacterium]
TPFGVRWALCVAVPVVARAYHRLFSGTPFGVLDATFLLSSGGGALLATGYFLTALQAETLAGWWAKSRSQVQGICRRQIPTRSASKAVRFDITSPHRVPCWRCGFV